MPRSSKRSVRPLSSQLLLGASILAPSRIGFVTGQTKEQRNDDLITYCGEGHLCTVAPTRSGKGTGVIITNLLHYAGPVIVFDPKGENYMVTARARRAMGHTVIKLDPCGVVDDETDSINPLDAMLLPNADIEIDSQSLAESIARGMTSSSEPFWDNSGVSLLSGAIMAAASRQAPDRRLGWAFDLLSADDVVYNLAVIMDTQKKTLPPAACREIASFLQITDVTRSGILSVAQSYIKMLSAAKIRRSFETTTFSLQDVIDGKPLSIYMILPSERIQSHASLLKLWLATFFKAILSRKRQPPLKTLVLLDEAGQLGGFPFLETMATLCGGYGLWLWMIYQDLAQLQAAYAKTWKTLLNNCGVLQVFGVNNRQMATGWAECLDSPASTLRTLRPQEQITLIQGQGEIRSRRLNYLTDGRFRGLFDGNRMYGESRNAPTPDAER